MLRGYRHNILIKLLIRIQGIQGGRVVGPDPGTLVEAGASLKDGGRGEGVSESEHCMLSKKIICRLKKVVFYLNYRNA